MNLAAKLILPLGFALLSSTPVLAQTNMPYQPGRSGVGLSLGYRQAILNDKLLGSRPSNLIRGPSGELLDVQRRGSQVFLRDPNSGSYLPGARPYSGWPTGLGTGLGWGGTSQGGGSVRYVGTPGSNSLHWISLLPSDRGQYSSSGLSPAAGGTPIDSWIQLLPQL